MVDPDANYDLRYHYELQRTREEQHLSHLVRKKLVLTGMLHANRHKYATLHLQYYCHV